MTNTVELGPEDNPNVTLEENNEGEPVLRHEPSGATFEYDSTAGNWSLTGGFGSLSVVEALINAPQPGDQSSVSDTPVQILNPGDLTDAAIVLQNGDDDEAGGATDKESKAGIYWMSAGNTNGGIPQRMVQLTADAHDNHFSLYTLESAVGSGGGTNEHIKRLDVDYGAASSAKATWQNLAAIQASLEADQDFFHEIRTRGDGRGGIVFGHGGITNAGSTFELRHRGDNGAFPGHVQLIDTINGGYVWTVSPGATPTIDYRGSVSKNVVWESDTTANRPSNPDTGQRFFDTDLGQPIWYDGGWVDAMGGSV